MEKRLNKHSSFLVDRMDPDFGLLDKLLAKRIITREEVHRIQLRDNTKEDRNRILLDLVMKKNKLQELITALRDSGQTHLANYLDSDGNYNTEFEDDWPLTEREVDLLEVNRESLVELIDISDLGNRLFSEKVINNRQRQFIVAKATDSEKNEALLDILIQCSLQKYKKMITFLHVTNQSHIAEILSEGGVVVPAHATIERPTENVDELENGIISQFLNLLQGRSMQEVNRVLELTRLGAISVRKSNSIIIYFHCKMTEDLMNLQQLLTSGQLKLITEQVFSRLQSTSDTIEVSFTWSEDEFKRGFSYFDNSLANIDTYESTLPEKKEKPSSLGFGAWMKNRLGRKKSRKVIAPGSFFAKMHSAKSGLETEIAEGLDELSLKRGTSTQIISVKPWEADDKQHGQFWTARDCDSALYKEGYSSRSTCSGYFSQYSSAPSVGACSRPTREELMSDESLFSKDNMEGSEHIKDRTKFLLHNLKQSTASAEDVMKSFRSRSHQNSDVTYDKMRNKELMQELEDERKRSLMKNEQLTRLQEQIEEYEVQITKLKEKQEGKTAVNTEDTCKKFKQYKANPTLITTISTAAARKQKKGISGIAISNNELFISSFQWQDIEVFDSNQLVFSHQWTLDKLINPFCLAFCKRNNCLYILDVTYVDHQKRIMRVDPDGTLINEWSTRLQYGSLSVSEEGNVILAAQNENTINEYTPEGRHVREMKLSTAEGFLHPLHAIKLDTGRFLVCHGEGNDPLHRVCMLDDNGHIRVSFGGQMGSLRKEQLDMPIYLTLNEDRFIFVVDRDNSRVVLLDPSLEFVSEIIPHCRDGLQRPERLVFDKSNGRLLIAHNDVQWAECRVFIFQIA